MIGLLLATGAWFLYWRETRKRVDRLRWLLPTLRAIAVFFIVLMLTGPVLHHRKVVGDLARILLFVDASESMKVTDEQMELPRKLLIAQELGWLPPEKFDAPLREATDQLARAQQLAGTARVELGTAEIRALAEQFHQLIESASGSFEKMRADAWPEVKVRAQKFQQELVVPTRKLAAESGIDTAKTVRSLKEFVSVASRWENEVRNAFYTHVERVGSKQDDATRTALRRFDAMTRWTRLETLLTGDQNSLLEQLAGKHHVELLALAGRKSEAIWRPEGGVEKGEKSLAIPKNLGLTPTNRATDLSDPIHDRMSEPVHARSTEGVKESERTAVLIFSDGQHNDGITSPLETARELGHRGVPVYTVGYGMRNPPQDLAVLEVRGPDSVFADARVSGDVILKDDMRPGLPFTLKIEHEGTLLYERNLVTEQKHERLVTFDFSVKEIVAAELKRRDKELKTSSLPLKLTFSVTVLEGEKDKDNNTAEFRLSAITQKPKLLLMDGRPRWEFRYLRNLFERDQRWDLNALLAGGGGEQRPWTRGSQAGQFPADRESLFAYQLICFGDIPSGQLRPEELEWLREFVEKRGGGLIFIDGLQEKLSTYAQTPLGNLLPVKWQGTAISDSRMKMTLVAQGAATLAPLMLASDAGENARVWAGLPAPHNLAPSTALPGAETLLEFTSRGQNFAGLVFRRYGAGRVLYAASDESWRWRYNVGDLYHQKFWNQIAKWIMEPPFPVQDKYVSLDSGPISYPPGATVEIRARIRDAQGRPVLKAKAEAQILKDGRRVAGSDMEPDPNQGGIFHGKWAALAEGAYEVRMHVDGVPDSEMKAQTFFTVAPQGTGEMAKLNCDEELLKQIASESGGQYFPEESAMDLLEKLKPLSQGRIVESDAALWHSYGWFSGVVLLLTVEWFLRKRAGML
jgi:uncharacterized membrane protein